MLGLKALVINWLLLMANESARDLVKALHSSDQLWSTITNSAMVHHVGNALEKGLSHTMSKMKSGETADFIRGLSAATLALLDLNFLGVESSFLIDAIRHRGLTRNPVAWLAMRPFYNQIAKICENGITDSSIEMPIMESVVILVGSEMAQRADEAETDPAPEDMEKDDVKRALESARQLTRLGLYPQAMVSVQTVLSWILRGGAPDLGESLPIPELDTKIPPGIMATFKTSVEYLNKHLQEASLKQMLVDGTIYGTHADRGGVFSRRLTDREWTEIFPPEKTPIFDSPEQFRRWIGRKLDVKGRRSNLKGW